MKKVLFLLAALALATGAQANLVNNGDFTAGLAGWTPTGATSILSGNPFGMPTSPNGDPCAGVISSWGGDWGGPLGSLSQSVGFVGPGVLSGELFVASRGPDTWRDATAEVLWNGAQVASAYTPGNPNFWAADWPWVSFSVPVIGTGVNTLEVRFTVHYAEWTWTGADNLVLVPEPGSLFALATGLLGFAFCRRK